MAALDFQVENIVLSEQAEKAVHKASQKSRRYQMDYYTAKFGEAEYREACKCIAIMLEAKKINTKTARKLLAKAEKQLRVHRPAISMEVSLANSSNVGSKHLGDKNQKMKSISAHGIMKGCDYGIKTVNYRVKMKKGGKHLF